MHYDGNMGGIFPNYISIMKDKITGKSIKINKKMSPTDIRKLNQMYPCDNTCGKLW